MPEAIYDINVTSIEGETFSMSRYRDRALLVVNVASQCGYTPQYAGLEALYRKYKDRGFVVLGFPCNQFGSQEPGDEVSIGRFCSQTYGVTFPLFRKINVNGPDAHPLFKFLKAKKRGVLGTEAIKWNFTKFLVDATGHVVARYGPGDTPAEIDAEIDRLLPAPSAV
jgi:glutathione peroxidase